jgi:ribosomal protein L37AE/L43A
MISQKCPRCKSDRIRLGYRPTPIWARAIGRYNLLCNNCNWEFAGFAVPGTTNMVKKKRAAKNSDAADQEEDRGRSSGAAA